MRTLCARPPAQTALLLRRAAAMVQTRRAAASASLPQRSTAAAAVASSSSSAAASALPWDDVHNLRDLSEADPARIRPGLVLRAAAPVCATEADAARLYGPPLGVRELIDLRSSDELRMQQQDAAAAAGLPSSSPSSAAAAAAAAGSPAFRGLGFCPYVRDPITRRSVPDPGATSVGDSGVMRVHIAPLEK